MHLNRAINQRMPRNQFKGSIQRKLDQSTPRNFTPSSIDLRDTDPRNTDLRNTALRNTALRNVALTNRPNANESQRNSTPRKIGTFSQFTLRNRFDESIPKRFSQPILRNVTRRATTRLSIALKNIALTNHQNANESQ
jgi:hypothetical protein